METNAQELERRIELLEQRLVDLAARCWQLCGTDFVSELADDIRRIKAEKVGDE